MLTKTYQDTEILCLTKSKLPNNDQIMVLKNMFQREYLLVINYFDFYTLSLDAQFVVNIGARPSKDGKTAFQFDMAVFNQDKTAKKMFTCVENQYVAILFLGKTNNYYNS